MSARAVKKGSPAKSKKQPKGIVLTPKQKTRQRERSIAIALSLGVLVILFFAVTLVKGPAVLTRPM
ncbi:MAG: CoxF protein [Afipia sp.]|nr:CoxF protein [Afipia sp.]